MTGLRDTLLKKSSLMDIFIVEEKHTASIVIELLFLVACCEFFKNVGT